MSLPLEMLERDCAYVFILFLFTTQINKSQSDVDRDAFCIRWTIKNLSR